MIIFVLIMLGLCLGSFINALVWRLHQLQSVRSAKQRAELSIFHGRSMCPHCKHTLSWYDLMPLLSWMSLGGRCRYCKKKISWQYPLVELATVTLFVISYLLFPHNGDGLAWALLVLWLMAIVLLVSLFVYDSKWQILPNKLTFPLLWISILHVLVLAAISSNSMISLRDALLGLLGVGGLFYVLFQISKGKWIGGGDVKLGFAIGLLAGGLTQAFLLIFLASLLGSVYSFVAMSGHNRLKSRIAFGPFLVIATIIVYLLSARMIDWYMSEFLIAV